MNPGEEIRRLEREVAHWKANHRNEVARARVLKERTDMPLERVKAYEQIGELQAEVTRLTKKLNEESLALYELSNATYRIGKRLIGESFEEDDEELVNIGKELVAESGLCWSCNGSGEDGDPEGGSYACYSCGGTGKAQHHSPCKEIDEGSTVQCPSY